MSKRAIIVPTVRPPLMAALMASLRHLPEDWSVYVAFQGYTRIEVDACILGVQGFRIKGYTVSEPRVPPFLARCDLLERFGDQATVWASLDDDIQLLPTVDYEAMALAVISVPWLGCVSGNWARSEKLVARAVHRREWIKQPIVYTAGGLLFGRQVVDTILAAPREPYLFDDVQFSLSAYVAGYENYRYRGSLVLHRISSRGGIQTIYRQGTMVHPDPKLITIRPSADTYAGTDNNYHIPGTGDLTALAKFRHMMARARFDVSATLPD